MLLSRPTGLRAGCQNIPHGGQCVVLLQQPVRLNTITGDQTGIGQASPKFLTDGSIEYTVGAIAQRRFAECGNGTLLDGLKLFAYMLPGIGRGATLGANLAYLVGGHGGQTESARIMQFEDLDLLHQRAQQWAREGAIDYDQLEVICRHIAAEATQRLPACDRNKQTAAAGLDDRPPVPYTRSRRS